MNANEIGRVKKIRSDPSDMISDCPNADSNSGPRIKVINKGAIGMPNFCMTYPIAPNTRTRKTSNTELLTL